MSPTIDGLLQQYEQGRVTRRDVVLTLSALFTSALSSGAAAAESQAPPAATPIAARTLNHASIAVADVDRSVKFYQSVFGMRVISREGTEGNPIAGGGQALPGAGIVVNLAPGPGPEFIGIYKAEPTGHIGHFCLGVQNFDADATLKTLKDRGITARMRTRGESKEIFLTDPDNIQVQLTDVTFCGGSGPHGSVCKP